MKLNVYVRIGISEGLFLDNLDTHRRFEIRFKECHVKAHRERASDDLKGTLYGYVKVTLTVA